MRKILLLLAFLLAVGMTIDANAQKKKNKKGNEPEKPKETQFQKLTKDTEKIEGFFTFYKKDGHLYMAVPEEKLNQEFLMNYEIAKGIGAEGLFGGTMLNIFEGLLVSLEKHDGKIFLVQKPHRYTAEEGTPEAAAVELSFGSSVLESAKIETDDKEDTVDLIDVHSWFVSDLSQISSRVESAVSSQPGRPGNASLDKSRSYLDNVKSFPENSNITAVLTFNNREQSGPREAPDSRYIPVSIHYTLAKLPEVPMKPRLADDRMGNFLTVHKDFTDDNNQTFFKRYVNKWRLECDGEPDENGLCTPKKPITYYIDRTVPVEYRQVMMDAVEAWQKSYEAAGFKNAIVAKMLPEDADPEDIRYATLRWNTSDRAGYGAIGPSIVDPRTGEIMDADILFEANMFLGFKNSWRSFVDPASSMAAVFGEENEEYNANSLELSTFSTEMIAQGSLLKSALVAFQGLEPGADVPEEVFNQFATWVTMHEVGHTLGLQHNFKSSADTPLDKLHDKEWTKENGVFSSVMEYPTPNINSNGENGYYYNIGPGSYDHWVISYAYTPDDKKAEKIARESSKQGHSYGSNPDAVGSSALDPLTSVYDLGGDPLAWGMDRAKLVKSLFNELPEIVLSDNTAYYELTNAYSTLLSQYAIAMFPAIKYIGGQYRWDNHKGDPAGKLPFEMVPKSEQEKALNFLNEYAFGKNAFAIDQKVLQQFGANRWYHWGNSTTYRGRIDFPYYETVASIQSNILGQLLNPRRLSRIRDAENKFGANNVVGIPQLFNDLTRSIWSEAYGSGNISSNRRDLQRAHLEGMTKMLVDPDNGTPADAIAVSRMTLDRLNGSIKRKLNASVDEYTRAHLLESSAKIEAALDANLTIED